MKASKRDIYQKLLEIELLIRRLIPPDFKHEDDAVRGMSAQISEAMSHLPPQDKPTSTEGK